jgi:predicted dehydrogenase
LLGRFVDAIRGADLELPTLADGLRSLEVVSAAEQAAASA